MRQAIRVFIRTEVNGSPVPEQGVGWIHATAEEFPAQMASLLRKVADEIDGGE